MKLLKLISVFLLLPSSAYSEHVQINALANEASPYLQRHANDPIHWHVWGKEALDLALTTNKPIFVSVGYSACHWCHIMEKESFENPEIAGFLNDHFISIKIDRETRPDLDSWFLAVTRSKTGISGWPNSVFLTPSAVAFRGTTYQPPDMFLGSLQQVAQAWKTNPATVSAEAKSLARELAPKVAAILAAEEIDPKGLNDAARSVLPQLDEFQGGFGHAPKFPRAPLLLFLFDQAQRTGDKALMAGVSQAIHAMIIGGIHDHIGGGFHRYATDPEWQVPHFEKMLFTQAMIGQLFIRFYEQTDDRNVRRAALRMFDFVLREMQDPKGGFFSSIDAVSRNDDGTSSEGAFYLWRQEMLESPFAFTAYREFEADGQARNQNILFLTDLPTGADFTAFDQWLEGLFEQRSKRLHPSTDRKLVLSWNAAMIATLAKGAHVFSEPQLFEVAEKAMRRVQNDMRTPTGYTRVYFDNKTDIAAQLPDLAALGLAFLALHDGAADPQTRKHWLQQATDLLPLMNTSFGPPDNGYRMTSNPDSFNPQVPLKDGSLPSGNALALSFLAQLSQRTFSPEAETSGYAIVDALAGRALATTVDQAAFLHAVSDLLHGPSTLSRWTANGALHVSVSKDALANNMLLDINLAEGWHINASETGNDFLIPTKVAIDSEFMPGTNFPKPVIKLLGFNDAPMALYEGEIRISVPLKPNTSVQMLQLQLQPCNDRICLQPRTLSFAIWD